MSVLGRSSRSPRSASSWRTQLRRASGCTLSCSPSRRNVGRGDDSRYSRTARSRSSSGYFFGAGNSAFLPGSQDRTSLGRLRRSGGTSAFGGDAHTGSAEVGGGAPRGIGDLDIGDVRLGGTEVWCAGRGTGREAPRCGTAGAGEEGGRPTLGGASSADLG